MFRIVCDPSSGLTLRCVRTHRRVSPDPLHQLLFQLAFLELCRTNLTFLFILQFKITLPNTKHKKNITSNFSQARSTLPDDGSQTIRNMSE